MGGRTKQGSREDLVSVLGFKIPGLSITVYTYFYSVCKDPASFPFQMAQSIPLTKTQTRLIWIKQNLLAVITPRDQASHGPA